MRIGKRVAEEEKPKIKVNGLTERELRSLSTSETKIREAIG